MPVGDGRILAGTDRPAAGQALELLPSLPAAALFFDAQPVANRATVYAEVFARPVTGDASRGGEVLDFGGAVLGFFREGTVGELCALSSKSATESVWISTGVQVPVTAAGISTKWLRLGIRLNRRSGRWDLVVNGRPVLAGLRAVPRAAGLKLWLYGHSSAPVWIDDVLISSIPPDELERRLARDAAARRLPALPAAGPQIVRRAQSSERLRGNAPVLRDAQGDIVIEDWHLSLSDGNRTYEATMTATSDDQITAYSPAYDEAGNALPMQLTITADAMLEPGADLRRLVWEIRELVGWKKYGALLMEGDFRTGLVQVVTLPPEITRKATAVRLGLDPPPD